MDIRRYEDVQRIIRGCDRTTVLLLCEGFEIVTRDILEVIETNKRTIVSEKFLAWHHTGSVVMMPKEDQKALDLATLHNRIVDNFYTETPAGELYTGTTFYRYCCPVDDYILIILSQGVDSAVASQRGKEKLLAAISAVLISRAHS
jgi:hypothetical protein